jgi:hypothetical protein
MWDCDWGRASTRFIVKHRPQSRLILRESDVPRRARVRPAALSFELRQEEGGEIMTSRSGSAIHSFNLPEDQSGLRETANLIESGQYDQLAELLRLSQAASERVGQSFLAEMFSAARHICLACSRSRLEKDLHRVQLIERKLSLDLVPPARLVVDFCWVESSARVKTE